MAPTKALSTSELIFGLVADYGWIPAAFTLLGGFVFARILLNQVIVFLQIFILPGTSLRKFGAKKGAWAVVTGATDGIGREFALQLAKAGFNILLVSRTQAKLEEVATEIESQYKVSTKIQTIDFQNGDVGSYHALSETVAGLDIGVLVNNVGRSHDIPVDFVDTPDDEMAAIIEINVNATLKVTKTILPIMLSRKNGLILNLGSFAGQVPPPMLATYAGSKAFLIGWTQALAEEVKSQGVVVQLLNTHFVVSKLSKIRKPSALIPTAKSYVRSALSSVGVAKGAYGRPSTSTPYWTHALLDWALSCIAAPTIFIQYVHGMNKATRKRALKKRADAKKQ